MPQNNYYTPYTGLRYRNQGFLEGVWVPKFAVYNMYNSWGIQQKRVDTMILWQLKEAGVLTETTFNSHDKSNM